MQQAVTNLGHQIQSANILRSMRQGWFFKIRRVCGQQSTFIYIRQKGIFELLGYVLNELLRTDYKRQELKTFAFFERSLNILCN